MQQEKQNFDIILNVRRTNATRSVFRPEEHSYRFLWIYPSSSATWTRMEAVNTHTQRSTMNWTVQWCNQRRPLAESFVSKLIWTNTIHSAAKSYSSSTGIVTVVVAISIFLQCFDAAGWVRKGIRPDWFTFLVQAHLRSPGKRAIKQVCVSHFKIPSALWRCWLGGIRCRCRLFAYGPADTTAIPKPHHLVAVKSRLVLPFWYRLVLSGSHPSCLCSPSSEIGSSPLKGCGVTVSLAESNGSLPPGLWLTSPAGWLPRTRISSGTLRSAIKYGLPFDPRCPGKEAVKLV